MTDAQREAFIKKRVEKILSLYYETHDLLSSMQPHERDLWVHLRIERALLASESILNQIETYLHERRTAWRDIIILDIISLASIIIIFSSLVMDLADGSDFQAIIIHLVSGFLAALVVMVISRIINYRLRKKASLIFEAMSAHVNNEVNTFTLDFLSDQIEIVNGDVELMKHEVSNVVKSLSEPAA